MRLDNDEFERIVRNYQTKLNVYVRQITRRREDAEEVVQDTFLRAYRALSAMSQEQRGTLLLNPWLYTIARNAALNHIRRGGRTWAPLDPSEDGAVGLRKLVDRHTPESIVIDNASVEEVKERLGRLPCHLREVARLRFLEDRSLSQIAYACGKPLGTVKSHLHRAVVSMRRAVGRAA